MLSAEHITVTFKRRDGSAFAALDDVSLAVPDGACVGLVGESGSGKSTLVRTICGLQKPDSGKIVFNGRDITGLPVRSRLNAAEGVGGGIQMIFQDASGALNPRQRVGAAIEEVGHVHGIPVDAAELLKKVGLPAEIRSRFPNELSGGQCQRICVARALALRPTLLIGDEPVSALDVSVQARILRLLAELRAEQGLSILLITHDLAVVSAVCDYVYVLEKGHLVEHGEPDKVFSAPQHPYTQRLLASVPTLTRSSW